ncbi:MAG: NADH-quinone oxidoreductase subunit N [Candidatus Omnitrophica bacterium]|nr:NADH-quinone oxidoreductase subunit N [Candidatus Omnitrophota bacterium]
MSGNFAVEITAAVWILVLLASDLIIPTKRKDSLWLLALLGFGLCGVALSSKNLPGFGVYFKSLFLLTAAVVTVMVREFQHHFIERIGSFFMLLFTALLGMFILASVNALLMLFLGLELLTFSLYIMAAYLKSDHRSVEAGMKYLILGSLSSALLVYGIALLYGFSGSIHFSSIQQQLSSGSIPATAQAGFLLVLSGLAFKIAAVPFHFWVPDVYEGAPTPVVALLSVGSKMAGIVALLRLLNGAFLPLQDLWVALLAILSAMTMLYGNLTAIPQTNIKMLLGYSSIGHAGYLIMGLSCGTSFGAQAVGYYLLAYLFSTLAVFLVVVVVSNAVGSDSLDSYAGLSRRSGFLAAVLFIGLLSLAGVPPLAGFVGKLLVLLATVERGKLWLVAIGAVNVAISLYYYLMVVKRMYLDSPSDSGSIPVRATTRVTLLALTLGIVVVGIFQEPFLNWIASAIR